MEAEELERFSLRQVSAEEMEAFEDHLLICEPCRLRFEDAETYVASMRRASAQWRAGQKPKTSWWSISRLIPVLAAVALLAVGLAALSNSPLTPAAPLALTLTATRGTAPLGTAKAGQAIRLTPDVVGISEPAPYRLEIVDAAGRVTWKAVYDPAAGPAQVPGQAAGPHFVRAYLQSGRLLREYGLDVQR
jgi:hypothetical protein